MRILACKSGLRDCLTPRRDANASLDAACGAMFDVFFFFSFFIYIYIFILHYRCFEPASGETSQDERKERKERAAQDRTRRKQAERERERVRVKRAIMIDEFIKARVLINSEKSSNYELC